MIAIKFVEKLSLSLSRTVQCTLSRLVNVFWLCLIIHLILFESKGVLLTLELIYWNFHTKHQSFPCFACSDTNVLFMSVIKINNNIKITHLPIKHDQHVSVPQYLQKYSISEITLLIIKSLYESLSFLYAHRFTQCLSLI